MIISNSTPYADGYGPAASPAAPQTAVPDHLKQADNPTYAGALNNMVRALMQGYGKYQQAHPSPRAGAGAVPGAPIGTGPTPNHMGVPPQMPAGQPVPYIGAGPLNTGVPPDPMAQALFSPPPPRPEVGPFPNMGNPVRPNPLTPDFNLNTGAVF